MQKQLSLWGLLASIDLYGCNPEFIRSPDKIKEFVARLCNVIKMKRHGETIVKRFGGGSLEGYSMFQFIETSSVTGHFDEGENRGFIDIFSCKAFDPELAGSFAKEFFQAQGMKITSLQRA